jgi:hypothetical protein
MTENEFNSAVSETIALLPLGEQLSELGKRGMSDSKEQACLILGKAYMQKGLIAFCHGFAMRCNLTDPLMNQLTLCAQDAMNDALSKALRKFIDGVPEHYINNCFSDDASI